MGLFVFILVVLALIAIIWGRPAAQGCAANILITLLILVAACVFFFALGAMGVSLDTITTLLTLATIGMFLFCLVSAVSGRVQGKRDQDAREARAKHAAWREAQRAQSEEDQAQAAFSAERNRYEANAHALRPALIAGDIRTAIQVCSAAGRDYSVYALSWDALNVRLNPWRLAFAFKPEEMDARGERYIILPQDERDALLAEVMSALGDAVASTSDTHAVAGLFAASGLYVPGDGKAFHNKVTPLLNSVAWDVSVSIYRRIAAILSLGLYGQQLGSSSAILAEGNERLAELTSDPDTAIRSAAVFALSLRLAAREMIIIVQNKINYEDDEMRTLHEKDVRKNTELTKQINGVIGGAMLPLIHDADERVRETVAAALSQVNSKEARAALMEMSRNEGEARSVRDAATSALRFGSSNYRDKDTKKLDLLGEALTYLDTYANQNEITHSVTAPPIPPPKRSRRRETAAKRSSEDN